MTKLISEEKAEGKVREVYDDIRSRFGMVPNLFKDMAHEPEWLETNWAREKRIMLDDAPLDHKTRELIAMAVSIVNNYDYCTLAHEAMARRTGASEAEIVHTSQIIEVFFWLQCHCQCASGYGMRYQA